VAAEIKRSAGIRGDLDHDGALAFLAGLLTILRGAGYNGLVLVLDEVETLQRVRSDEPGVREGWRGTATPSQGYEAFLTI
jgi:hypothetical protein